MISVGGTLFDLVVYIVLTGVLSLVANYLWQLITKINQVYDFTLQYKERHDTLERDMKRIEGDLSKQLGDLSEKVDRLILQFQTPK